MHLESYNAKHAQFKILPRYKVKSEGEFVSLVFKVIVHYLYSSSAILLLFFVYVCHSVCSLFCTALLDEYDLYYKSACLKVKFYVTASGNDFCTGAVSRRASVSYP